MMVGVQEQKLLLFQHQENGINQLQVFSQVVQVVQGNQFWSKRILVANSVEKTVMVQDWN